MIIIMIVFERPRLFVFFFFFSSRRRHTRFDCDWSSDVCSSDLELYAVPTENTGRGLTLQGGSAGLFGISGTDFGALFHPGSIPGSQTTVRPLGPATANPDERYYAGDHNNFGPAVGLAWS